MGKVNVGTWGGRAGRARLHGRWLQALFAAAVVPAALALCSVPASAFSQQGHEFAGSFGESGEAANPAKPSAIAVNESSGTIYVAESANNRVVVYGSDHKFTETWGFGVKDGADKFETCNSGPTSCRPGIAGGANGQFNAPPAIAVDNSGGESEGDVYVVANRKWNRAAAVFKFTPAGTLLGDLFTTEETKAELDQPIAGVAVDHAGTVWVELESAEEDFSLEQFSDGKLGVGRTNPEELEEFTVLEDWERPLINEWFNVAEFHPEELEVIEQRTEVAELPHPVKPGFAIDSAGRFYVTYEPFGHDFEELTEHERGERKETVEQPCVTYRCFTEKFVLPGDRVSDEEPETLIGKLDDENTTGVAVDVSGGEQSNDVFLDNGSSVAAFTPSGSLIQRFAAKELEDGGGSGLAVDSATHEVLVADSVAGKIDTYKLEKPGAPVVEPGSPQFAHAGATSVELLATLDFADAAEPHALFEFGPGNCASSECTQVEPAQPLKQEFGEQHAAVELSGLDPSTVYHFRVTAKSALGSVTSAEGTFTTQPSAVEASLLDGRAWELVSPGDKHGGAILPLSTEGGLIEAAANGQAVTYEANTSIGENVPAGFTGGPSATQVFGTRKGTRWTAEDIVTEHGAPAQGLNLGGPWEYEFFSPNLETALLHPFAAGSPSQQTEGQTNAFYLRNMETCAAEPATCYKALFLGPGLETVTTLEGATPDLAHALVESTAALTPEASPEASDALYEWSKGAEAGRQLKLVSVLPDGDQAAEGALAAGNIRREESRAGAISDNGSRVTWSYEAGGEAGLHIFMREFTGEGSSETAQTLQVDEPDTGAPEVEGKPIGVQAPTYQGASATGSQVFFTDPQRLTENATAGAREEQQSLYVFEPELAAHERVTDLTPSLVKGEQVEVQGGILGSSHDGSYVYFVANGVLATGAEPGDCRAEAPAGAGCNLYVVHHGSEGWEAPRFIARLSAEDSPAWGDIGGAESYIVVASKLSSRVSPSGEWLAFMSSRSLKGYDNRDANSGIPDEEVYLFHYDPTTEHPAGDLVCASCNPSGARPVGVFDTSGAGEGAGLQVDRPHAWGGLAAEEFEGVDEWLAGSLPGWTPYAQDSTAPPLYQSRYLSDSGRLFFNSADALVPLKTPTREETIKGVPTQVGVENVYEYEPKEVGSCDTENTAGGCVQLLSSGESDNESSFLDASETGDDVFFLTAGKLSPLDPQDGTFDIYDARVCTSTSGPDECPPTTLPHESEKCSGQVTSNCRPPSAPPQVFPAPASASASGSGNTGASEVRGETVTKPKPKLTTKQKLAAALKKCHKLKQKKKRVTCEKQAHKRYPTKKKPAKRAAASLHAFTPRTNR